MKSAFLTDLVNGKFGDPCLYVEIAWEARALLFDLGANERLAPRRLLKVSDAFVSHAHINHFIGFDNLMRRRLAHAEPLRLFGPPELSQRVTAKLSGYTWNLAEGYPFELEVVDIEPHALRRVGLRARERFRPVLGEEVPFDRPVVTLLDEPLLKVEATLLDHRIPCVAYALSERLRVNVNREALGRLGLKPGKWLTAFKEKIRAGAGDDTTVEVEGRVFSLGSLRPAIASVAPGQKLAYVVDAAFSEENIRRIVELAGDADLLFCEAAFLHRDAARAREAYRLTARQAGWLAREAGARRLEVFHVSPRYQEDTDAVRREAESAFRGETAP